MVGPVQSGMIPKISRSAASLVVLCRAAHNSGMNMWLTIFNGLLPVVIITGILYMMLRKARIKPTQPQDPTAKSRHDPPQNPIK
jgi:hypothetical protein